MTIGIGITTRNRPGRADDTARRIRALSPLDTAIIIVDDASEEPVGPSEWAGVRRLHENFGIARAKNECLAMLQDCDHIFLFDDDAYPLVEDWWRPYVESPEPHLMYVFEDLAGDRKLRDITKLYEDAGTVAWSGPRGVMLYIDAKAVLPIVGGMDPIYGKWGYEHGDWSNRIFAAGLTSFRYADVPGSDALIHSMDQYEELERSVVIGDRVALARKNAAIHNQRRDDGYTAYVEYRDIPGPQPDGERDVVITHLYSSKPDPARPALQYPATLEPAEALLESIVGDVRVTVIADTDLPSDFFGPIDLVRSELAINVFFQRHLDSWRYLRDHPEIRYVWCVDATDVEMLNEPWDEMVPGTLYIGYEPKKLTDAWLSANHPSTVVQAHIRRHRNDTMLNPGVVGGDRATVMSFLHDMFATYFDTELRRTHGRESGHDFGDMGVTQVVGYAHRDHLMTGPRVVNEFRSYDKTGNSWWAHK